MIPVSEIHLSRVRAMAMVREKIRVMVRVMARVMVKMWPSAQRFNVLNAESLENSTAVHDGEVLPVFEIHRVGVGVGVRAFGLRCGPGAQRLNLFSAKFPLKRKSDSKHERSWW